MHGSLGSFPKTDGSHSSPSSQKFVAVGEPEKICVSRGEDSPYPRSQGTLVVVEMVRGRLFHTVTLGSAISNYGAQQALTNQDTLTWTGITWDNPQFQIRPAECFILLDCPEHRETVQRTTHQVEDEMLMQVVSRRCQLTPARDLN
jgi:hypothetical protein